MPKSIFNRSPTLRRVRYFVAGLVFSSLLIGLMVDTSAPLPATATGDSRLQLPSARDSLKLLGVPYIDQGPTRWCFQTALSMVLQYNGKNVLPGDIARANNQSPNRATSILDVLFGWVDLYVSRWTDLSLHRSLADWSFQQFQEVLSDGRGEPIIVSTFGIPGHTLVVVGYCIEDGKEYLYLHDPSGYLTEYKWDTGSRVYAKVTWEQFARSYWVKVFVTYPQMRASTQAGASTADPRAQMPGDPPVVPVS